MSDTAEKPSVPVVVPPSARMPWRELVGELLEDVAAKTGLRNPPVERNPQSKKGPGWRPPEWCLAVFEYLGFDDASAPTVAKWVAARIGEGWEIVYVANIDGAAGGVMPSAMMRRMKKKVA